MSILPHDEILALHAAVISAQLVASRSALLAGIDARLVAGLSQSASASDQILEDLSTLNNAELLEDHSAPLEGWLTNAVARAAGRKEATVFQQALDRTRVERKRRQTDRQPNIGPNRDRASATAKQRQHKPGMDDAHNALCALDVA